MTKKVRITLIGLLAALLCITLSFGIALFGKAAKAEVGETPDNPVKLSAAEDFIIDENGKLTGLSDKGGNKVSDDWEWTGEFNKYFELVFPANVTSVVTADFIGSYNLPNDKLVKVSFAEGSLCTSLKANSRWSHLFRYCTALKEVDFTNAVNLADIIYPPDDNYPNGKTDMAIGSNMFYHCTSLSKVTFAPSLTGNAKMSIAGNAFGNTALEKFEIPAYVTSIASTAFSECAALATITVAEGNTAFTYYTDENGERYDQAVYTKDADGTITGLALAPAKMTKITLPKAVLDVNYVPEENEDEATTAANIAVKVVDKAVALNGVVSAITDLETIEIEENDELYAYGNCLFVKEGSKLTSEALDSIEEYSSLSANDLVTAPHSVKKITLPAGFIYEPVGSNADDQNSYFWYCLFDSLNPNASGYVTMRKLKTISVDADNPVYTSVDGSLFKKQENGDCDYSDFWIPYATTTFTVPAGMTTELSALSQKLSANKLLQEVKVGEGNTAYVSCDGSLFKKDYSDYYIPSGATRFTVPAGMTKLDFSVLSANNNLQEVIVEKGNTAFTSFDGALYKNDGSKFWVPSGRTSLTIPAKVVEFDFSALANCKSLQEVKIGEGHPTYISEGGIIYDKGKTELLFINVGVDVTEFYAPATLERIEENAFAVYEGDKRVANKVKKVYVEDVEAWSRIRFGERIETAEQYEQYPDGRLSEDRRRAVAGGLVSGYGANPMSGGAEMYVKNEKGEWELLESLVIDFDGEISDVAFAGCTSLRTVTVGNKVTRIGEMSFALCKNIRSISVPYIGCTKKYYSVYSSVLTMGSAYAWEVFGGRGLLSGSFGFNHLAPDTIDTYTVTGYNILEEAFCADGYGDDSGYTYPVYLVPDNAFLSAPVRKVVISIDETDGHDITLGPRLFIGSTVSEVDLENSKVIASKESFLSNSATESFIKKLTLPNTMKEIYDYFFFLYANKGISLEEVIIPEGVQYIGRSMFGNLDTLTLPASIGGIKEIFGVKTVYLTGWTDYDNYSLGSIVSDSDADSGVQATYVALDSEVYAALPRNAKIYITGDDYYENHISNKVFYQADVVFSLKDSTGKEIARTTEKHLASANGFTSHLNWVQKQGARGDVYWAIDESYALPDTIGNYKVENTKWTLDGSAVTKDTCLKGEGAQYVIEQTLDAGEKILLKPADVVKQYDGEAWNVPTGMEITHIEALRGGNGYSSYSKAPVIDVGTYSVTAKCNSGYAWYDYDPVTNPVETRTFTLEITPLTVELEWFISGYGAAEGVPLSGIHERVYDGTSAHRAIYAEFTDAAGTRRKIDYSGLTAYSAEDLANPVYKMADVGLYQVKANETGKTADGVWLGNYTFENVQQFRINQCVIDLNDYNKLAWGLDVYNSSLRDGDLYIYGGKPYVYEHPELGAPDSTFSVLNSIVRLRSSTDDHKIIIHNIPESLSGIGTQYTAVYSGNIAHDVGKYTATAELKVLNGNYVFGYSLGGDLKSRGMTITINPDGTASITKVWYVVAIDNGMLKADGTEFDIPDWIFGEDVTVGVPRLEHGDENDNYITNTNIRFELTRNGLPIGNTFTRTDFTNYINKSMPAGKYELTCTVANVSVGSHTHWWNNEEHGGTDSDVLYHGFTRKFVFTVGSATIDFNLPEDTGGGYLSYEWKLARGREAFFGTFDAAINAAGIVGLTEVTPAGYWAEHSEEYYGEYAVTYNFARMYNNTYLSVADENLLKHITGGTNATYTVYFQVTAPNHSSLTELGEGRYAYYFTVVVYEEVAAPTVDNLTYTGSSVRPALEESALYTAVLSESDIVTGGSYSVSFKLADPVHYRWAASESATVDGDKATVGFVVEQAVNEWIRHPNIIAWNYGSYSANANPITAVPRYLDEGKEVLFSIVKKDGTEVSGLKNFTVDENGLVLPAVATALNKLDAGSYLLITKVEGTGNYLEKVTNDTAFVIAPANNEWVVTPNVIRWSYGGYDKNVNLIIAKARLENKPVEFIVYSDAAHQNALTDWFVAEDGIVPDAIASKLAALNQGTYYLAAKVDADGANYSGLSPEHLEFRVAKASNNWVVTPNVIAWSYGSYDRNVNLVLGTATHSDAEHPVIFKITTDAARLNAVEGLDGFIAENGVVSDDIANLLKVLNQGTYYLSASVSYAAGDNYAGLLPEAMEFSVTKAANNWLVVPNVINWSYGGYDKTVNLILATARYSDATHPITFSITTDAEGKNAVDGLSGFTLVDGNVTEAIAAKLAAFNQGTYYLVASVNYGANDNYTSLSPEATSFTVSKAINSWAVTPGVTTWIVGEYNDAEGLDGERIIGSARFGAVEIVITVAGEEDNVVYDPANGIDRLNEAEVGLYTLTARVRGTDDYSGLEYTFNFQIFPEEGLPWWATLCITVGALLLAALILFILWKKGVFQILTGKIVLAIRTKASIDATIASVRAAKKMEEGRKSVAEAKRKERFEEMKAAREAQKSMPAEERAALLEAKAEEHAKKAEKMRSRSESMKKRAERMRGKAESAAEATEATAEDAQSSEAAATDENGSAEE